MINLNWSAIALACIADVRVFVIDHKGTGVEGVVNKKNRYEKQKVFCTALPNRQWVHSIDLDYSGIKIYHTIIPE